MRRWGALILAVLLVSACFSPGGNREAHRYFVLDIPAPAGVRTARRVQLQLQQTSATRFYDTHHIVYSRTEATRAYYQFSGWTERPSRRIHKLLVERLEHAGIVGVADPQPTLHVHVEELFHEAKTAPGTARIRLSAELMDAGGVRIAQRQFSGSAPAPSYDAEGAVRAFGVALAPLLDDIVAWVDATAPR